MGSAENLHIDYRRLLCRAEALRARCLRRWLARLIHQLGTALATRRAEAELRALDTRELQDLGLDRGGLAYAARHGRDEPQP